MLLVPRDACRGIESGRPLARVLLRCDETGCTLSGGRFERRFRDLQTAIDSARQSGDTATATIEIWQDGQYICCKTPPSLQCSDTEFPDLSAPRLISDAWLAAAERYANHIGRVLMAAAGPIFWFCLVAMVVAASLGWQLLRQ